MDKLTELAVKYGTDKWGKHHYTPVYFDLFNDRRNDIKKVLEIGVAEGAGVRMFRDFFPSATIYGAEIDPGRLIKEERIVTMSCDQRSLCDLKKVVKTFGKDIDIVIDDGSHIPEHQVFTCNYLMSKLKKGVTYIIEDVSDVWIIKELDKYACEVKKVGKRYDDCLIIVRHK